MSASRNPKKVRCKNPTGSPQRVDGRAGRTETAETRTRWVAEWQAPNANWREASWQWSDEETARKGLSTVLQGSRDKWRLVEVVVVERRRVVKRLKTASPIDPSSPTESA